MPGHVEYSCEVREVFSGDDLIALIDLGVENLFKKQRIRLAGVDTPNAVKESGNTVAGQLRSLVRALTKSRKGRITVVGKNANSWVVTLVVETPEGSVNVNEYLIAQGYQFKGKVEGVANV
jgi:endonuclease YncB( thermonuclease family)